MNTRFHDYDALLFDLDGTLVDSMAAHNQAWVDTLSAHGYEMTFEILRGYAGIPNEVTVDLFNKRFGWRLDTDTIVNEKESRFLRNINQVKVIEPVYKIARERREQNKPMAIVTGGTPDMVSRILGAVQGEELFHVRVCAGDVPRGKPAPDPFLHAAKLLKVTPARCLVFEDGEPGIAGAKAAGMAVVKVERDFALTWL